MKKTKKSNDIILNNEMNTICKYCGKYTKLCKAHIVPRLFYQAIKRLDDSDFLYVHDGQNRYESTTKIGFWDNHILCPECDRKLGVYDNNFFTYLTTTNFNFFRNNLDSCYYYPLIIGSKIYQDIKLFFAALLYRASLSKISFTRNVNLEQKYIKILENFIKGKSHDIYELAIIPIKLHSLKRDPRKTLSSIYKHEIDGVNGYSIMLYGFKFWIKLDELPVPKALDIFTIHEGKILIPEEEFEETRDYEAAIKLARKFRKLQL